jgi:peroxiredoxin (alkyl hydroperoxide reductase subunit C)
LPGEAPGLIAGMARFTGRPTNGPPLPINRQDDRKSTSKQGQPPCWERLSNHQKNQSNGGKKMEQSSYSMPLLGDTFPEIKVMTTHGPMNIPADLKGSWFVLFSHPADYTPVCTTEFVAFQKRFDEFEKLNCKLIGMSVDQVFSHMKWGEWIDEKLDVTIKFPIIAAGDAIASKLGMLHPNKGTNTVRAVFVVDPESKVRLILYYPQELGRNMDEILRAVQALQISDKEGVAMPAGWPNNELLGDRVIVPPPTDEKAAKERKKQYDNYDWWFCHRPLKK